MTIEQKIISYLGRCTYPKTQAEIARGANVNPNTLRKVLGGLMWKLTKDGSRNSDKHISLIRTMTPRGFGYRLA